jgi:DNA-binding CsgD family transcriptional regulator
MITNTGASDILQPADRRQLWRWATAAEPGGEVSDVFLELANGVTVEGSCYPVELAGRLVGVVLHLSVLPYATAAASTSPTESIGEGPDYVRTSYGVDPALLSRWSNLTDSERSVAELVGRGVSNKQAGRQLFISRYTVDYHLRGIYRKLGISSRVELARLLGEHCEALAGPAIEDRIA